MSGARGRIIGLTGGIGSGKSTAASRFAKLGACVLDADAVSRALLEKDGGCYRQTVEAFGKGILLPDGAIDRKALGKIVFQDEEQREKLNGIVHPAVIEKLGSDAARVLAEEPDGLVVLDVPLLFECGMEKDVDMTVLVCAPDEERVRRIVLRDGCTEEQAKSRIRAQMPQAHKMALADVILDNGGTKAHLLEQVDGLYERLTVKPI